MILRRFATWDSCLAAATIALFVAATLWTPNFAGTFNLSQGAAGFSEKALLVLPLVPLIIAREIDLSVASILALSSVVLGVLIRADFPLFLAIVFTLGVGAIAGSFNGALVTRLGLPSLVVTLGTLALFRGVGYMILGSASVNELPAALTDFGIRNVPGTPIPWTIVPFIVLAPIFAVVLQHTAVGRRIYAIGGNPDTALYSGIHVRRLRFWLFVVSGIVCAVAGIVLTARLSNARANNALGFELDVITIALLGGVERFRRSRQAHRCAVGAGSRCDCAQCAGAQSDRRRCAGDRHRTAPDRGATAEQYGRAVPRAAPAPSDSLRRRLFGDPAGQPDSRWTVDWNACEEV